MKKYIKYIMTTLIIILIFQGVAISSQEEIVLLSHTFENQAENSGFLARVGNHWGFADDNAARALVSFGIEAGTSNRVMQYETNTAGLLYPKIAFTDMAGSGLLEISYRVKFAESSERVYGLSVSPIVLDTYNGDIGIFDDEFGNWNYGFYSFSEDVLADWCYIKAVVDFDAGTAQISYNGIPFRAPLILNGSPQTLSDIRFIFHNSNNPKSIKVLFDDFLIKRVQYTEDNTPDNEFLLSDNYLDITGQDTISAFFQRKNELPEEIPLIASRIPSGENVFFVSNEGADTSAGNITAPFKTLNRAINEYKSLINKEGGAVIYLREGTYRLDDCINIDAIAPDGAPLFITAYNNEEVKFTAGREITGFEKITGSKERNRLHHTVRDKVLVADLGMSDYGEITLKPEEPQVSLYSGSEKLRLARWPNIGATRAKSIIQPGPIFPSGYFDYAVGFTFEYNNKRPESWKNDGQLYMYGSFFEGWLKSIIRIKEIDPENSSIETVNCTGFGEKMHSSNDYYYFNIFEELDTAGEWYLDREAGKLYLYPLGNDDEITLLTTAHDLLRLNNTENIIIDNITLDTALGSGIVVNNGRKNIIQNCTIKNMGDYGAKIVSGYQNGLTGCSVIATEQAAVMIDRTDNDLKNLIPSRNFLQNSIILGDSDSSIYNGVRVRSVGAVVSHNLVSNMNAAGITVDDGAENIIEYNEITASPRSVRDCSLIYVGGSVTNRGNHIRYNYLHDNSITNITDSVCGVYFDDMNSDNYAYGNLLDNIPTGFYSHNGKEVVVYNNIIMNKTVNNASAITDSKNYYNQGKALWYNILTDPWNYQGNILRNIVDPYSEKWLGRFPFLERYRTAALAVLALYNDDYKNSTSVDNIEKDYRSPSNNYFGNNLIYNHCPIKVTDVGMLTVAGLSTNYVTQAEPIFSDSEAYISADIVDFEPVPFHKMGLVGNMPAAGDYSAIYPINGEGVHGDDILIKWSTSTLSNMYTLEIATDKSFTNIIHTAQTQYNSISVDSLEEGNYFWRVTSGSWINGVEPKVTSLSSFRVTNELEDFLIKEVENGVAKIINNTGYDKICDIVLTCYDNYGRLNHVELMLSVNIESGITYIEEIGDADHILLLDSLGSLTPLSEKYQR